MHVYIQISKEGTGSPAAGVTVDYKLPYGCWEPNLGLQEEQQVLLITELPYLSSPYLKFKKPFLYCKPHWNPMFILILFHYFMCKVCGWVYAIAYTWRSEDTSTEPGLALFGFWWWDLFVCQALPVPLFRWAILLSLSLITNIQAAILVFKKGWGGGIPGE